MCAFAKARNLTWVGSTRAKLAFACDLCPDLLPPHPCSELNVFTQTYAWKLRLNFPARFSGAPAEMTCARGLTQSRQSLGPIHRDHPSCRLSGLWVFKQLLHRQHCSWPPIRLCDLRRTSADPCGAPPARSACLAPAKRNWGVAPPPNIEARFSPCSFVQAYMLVN